MFLNILNKDSKSSDQKYHKVRQSVNENIDNKSLKITYAVISTNQFMYITTWQHDR